MSIPKRISDKKKTEFYSLWSLFEKDRWHILAAIGIFFIKHSPVWLMPLLTANVIDLVVTHQRISELWWNAVILALLLAQNIPMHVAYMKQLSIALRRMETRLRFALSNQFQKLSMGFYTRASAGILQNKVVRDVESIVEMVRQMFDGGLSAIFNLLGAVVITAIRVPKFLPFFLIMVPISAALISSMRKRLFAHNSRFRKEIEKMSARVNEMTHLLPITRAHGLETNELEFMESTLAKVKVAGLELDNTNAIFGSLSWVIYNIFNVICLISAVALSYYKIIPITAGDVVMLTGYFTSLTNAVMSLVNLIPNISKGFESIQSIEEILQSEELEKNDGKLKIEKVNGDFIFDRINFIYPEARFPAIRNFSLSVNAGESIALVGHSGAGKSTIINLIIGFIRPDNGRILIDGHDMNEIDLRTYRRFISVVPQESILFEDTIRENICYGIGAISEKDVETALRDANAWEFVQQLPEGIDTPIGEHGAKLSGGEKQRLSIARALIRNPKVLILDEATSALDIESEKLIQESLSRLMKDRTTFIVAHRLSTIQNADRIVVLDQGNIVEIGNHKELMAKKGVYFRLQSGNATSI
ncbi:ABC transporter [Ornatilinea apprima]|uniref:ABC transporter n=1 Tax=Ornatilinea apprima TaxID=1134406 RepID=A0A0P6WPQ0_9CHLR|nr:ABC transporter ATP-binding protein [Ornatilinea apprima]KPL72045.1 ABC transporter [Ornatilinea apprima]